ncbi:Cytochrome P450 10 [Trichoplax sp. H2]|nr:Cytochrome P450 10 [Trichoplax sp. H2]|eukprot:RDD37947.1 Cytochrome P450 10 [Trichoplax sp. H2]
MQRVSFIRHVYMRQKQNWNYHRFHIRGIPSSVKKVMHEKPADLDPNTTAMHGQAIKPFEHMPGSEVSSLRNMINLVLNFKYETRKPHQALHHLFQSQGPIFKKKFAGFELVMLSDPKDIECAFRTEGKYPRRFDMVPWSYYREERKLPLGILLSNDEQWKETRSAIDKRLLKLNAVQGYSKIMNKVIDDFIAYLLRIRGKHGVKNEILGFESQTFRWSLETILSILFDKRIGCLQEPPSHDGELFHKALIDMTYKTSSLIVFPPYYKYIKTRYWNEFCSHWDTMYDIGLKIIQERRNKLASMKIESSEEDEVDFLTDVMLRSNLSEAQLNITLLDLMIGATDTTANTINWTLLLLSQYPKVQEKLYQEITNVLNDGEDPDAATVHKAPYLRACIKESMRIYPAIVRISRTLQKDVALSGYHVPANTAVVACLYEVFHNEANYPEPEIFKPERWIKGTHPESIGRVGFKFIPFGFGPRMCLGRRIAELEMHLLLAKLVKKFIIGCNNRNEIQAINRISLIPDRPMKIILTER